MNKFAFLFLVTLTLLLCQCKKESIEDAANTSSETETPVLAFTTAEIDLILEADSATSMYILNYFIPEDSVLLRSVSKDVLIESGDTVLKRLTDRMYTTVRNTGVGIAAPQVGVLRNVMWVQRYDKGTFNNRPFEVYLNPVITAYSDTVVRRPDGCLSVPQGDAYPQLTDSSYRALWVDVAYYLPDGQFVEERITQWLTAHIFQHEIDHLNGIMFFDRYVKRYRHIFTVFEHREEHYADIYLEMGSR